MNIPPDREAAIFDAARQLPASQREDYLDEACLGDAALRQRVSVLLQANDAGGNFFKDMQTVADASASAGGSIRTAFSSLEQPGDRIGRYKLLQQIGEGGCGVVYMAEQDEPVRRRVALKVIKLGMDTKEVIARFEAERQALALMDHPNIAKVLDAGATDAGRPFFVMELVRGIKITDYCDQANLSTRDRVDLFIKVCLAIQHAHQKGIIHRDIKPSNILVTMNDGVPLPKVIDFGIAKATNGRLTDQTLFTAFEQFMGTPAYMSPEQAEMSALDIDTRTDVYSLGVLLYELLTGETPFNAGDLLRAGIDEMRRQIREREPARPSTRLSTMLAANLTTVAAHRRSPALKLIHLVRGDLDWIVMKCLEKDRTRRYETANGLAADLKRHLNNEPVFARPPSTVYRIQKAFRRHKLVFLAGGAVAAALLLGTIVSTWLAVRAKRAEARAVQSRGDAEKLSNFMLDEFYEQLEPNGQYETVAKLARRAVAYYDSLPASLQTPETDRNRTLAQARLALITSRQGDVKSALSISEKTLAKLAQMRKRGDGSDEVMFALGLAVEAQAWCYRIQGDFRSQAGALQQGVGILRPLAISADGSRRVKLEYANLLNILSHVQPPEQGMVTCEEALRILGGLGATDLSDLSGASAWADIADSEAREAMTIGRLDDAERLEKQAETLAQGVLARRPGDLRARMDFALAPDELALIEARRFHDNDALRLETQCRQAVEDYLRFNPSDAHGREDLNLADYGIGALLYRQGRVSEALQKEREAIQVESEPGKNGGVAHHAASFLWAAIARWEAQRENRGKADQALQEAGRSVASKISKNRVPEIVSKYWAEWLEDAERQVRQEFGEDATVYEMAGKALPRLGKLKADMTDPTMGALLLSLQRRALDEAARSAVNLGRFAGAETAARELISLHAETDDYTEHLSLDQPDDLVWGQVLLAQADVGQKRKAEAQKMLEPALGHYHDAMAQGATCIAFRHHFARALYVQALAESADSGGTARSREALAQAAALLQSLSDEGRQLHDSKQLLSWITAAQKN